MRFRFSILLALSALCAVATVVRPGRADNLVKPISSSAAATPQQGRSAIERGLDFIQKDAAKWRKEKTCASCHQGLMTLWALNEAKNQGYAITSETLADTASWTKERIQGIEKPRDTRPGWSMVNTPALYMMLMAQTMPKQPVISADEQKQIADHLLRHQEADGSWAWSLAPAQNRPPPFFESDEVATLMASMVLGSQAEASKENSEVRAGLEKATAWLAKTEPSDTTQAAAMRLLANVQTRKAGKTLRSEMDTFLKRQNEDGGWSQVKGIPSDAYATGQALYVLSLAGVKNNRPEVRRGISYLVSVQKEDGSWPMTSRAQPGATPFKNPVPIIYIGSAWATLGLLRSVPK